MVPLRTQPLRGGGIYRLSLCHIAQASMFPWLGFTATITGFVLGRVYTSRVYMAGTTPRGATREEAPRFCSAEARGLRRTHSTVLFNSAPGGLRVSEESTPRAFCLLRCHHTTERIQDTHRRGRPSGSVGDQRHKPPHWWSLRFQEEPTFGTFDGISWAATKLVPTVLICIPRTGLPVLPQPPGSLEETWGVVSLGGCLTLGPRAASGLKTAVDTQSVVIAQPIPRHPAV